MYYYYLILYIPSPFLLFRDYVEMENKWCGPKLGKEYQRLLDAQTACDQDRNCRMFYDLKSENKAFVLCGSDSFYDNLYNNFNYYEVKRSEFLRSRLYMKCEYLTVCSCRRKANKMYITLSKSLVYFYITFTSLLPWRTGDSTTIAGPDVDRPCHFPFEYGGTEHKQCIMDHSNDRPWCSVSKYVTSSTIGNCSCFTQGRKSIINVG